MNFYSSQNIIKDILSISKITYLIVGSAPGNFFRVRVGSKQAHFSRGDQFPYSIFNGILREKFLRGEFDYQEFPLSP